MRGVWARVSGLVLLVSALFGAVLVDAGLLDAGPAETGTLLLGALLLVWGVAQTGPSLSAPGPAVAARDRRRAVARRSAPRQHDPDAAGHTRSRAPSETSPAV